MFTLNLKKKVFCPITSKPVDLEGICFFSETLENTWETPVINNIYAYCIYRAKTPVARTWKSHIFGHATIGLNFFLYQLENKILYIILLKPKSYLIFSLDSLLSIGWVLGSNLMCAAYSILRSISFRKGFSPPDQSLI